MKQLLAAVALSLALAACGDDGGGETEVTPSLPASGSPAASGLPTQPPPTGEVGGTDAFLIYREASGDLIAHNLASGERYRRRIDFNSQVVVQLQCTRDGSRIAYLTQVFGEEDRNLEILGEDPTDEPLSLPATIQGISWSPDGEQMAITDYDGIELTHSIGILDVESGDIEEISSGEDFAGSISWSPDGASIAYYLQSIEGGTTDIHVIPVEGGEQQTVTPGGQIAWYDPEWAPEGNTLLIAGLQEGNFQLYELDVETGEQRQITESDIFKRGARYSPDGTTIAYTGSALEPQVSLNGDVSTLVRHLPADQRWHERARVYGRPAREPGRERRPLSRRVLHELVRARAVARRPLDTGTVILLHVGGASTASIVVSIVVIFFFIFAISFAFGPIPEGGSRLSGDRVTAWFRASLPRLAVAGAFAAALGAAGILLGDDPGDDDNAANAATCDAPLAPYTGNPPTEDRLIAAADGWRSIAAAAREDDIDRVRALYYTTDAHNLTHDIDGPLREVDNDLAGDMCLAVIVIENQMLTGLDTEVIARESDRVAAFLDEARPAVAALPTSSPGPTSAVCATPIGAVTDQPLTEDRIGGAVEVLREIAATAATAPQGITRTLFLGDAHNITHDIDGPLRAADEELAIELCRSVLELEQQLAGDFDVGVIVQEAEASAAGLEAAGRALGISE